ncbi:MAG: PAS domain S-box protein [Dehalococcoidales bacterium]|nr:PAS domain S-box protein [Dehalococcoidales bacterium]
MKPFRADKKYAVLVFSVAIIAISLAFFALSVSKPSMGLVLSLENDAWVVKSVDPAGAASYAGILPGDKPEMINGQSAEEFLEKYEAYGNFSGFLIREITVVDSYGQIKTVDFEHSSPHLKSIIEVLIFMVVSLVSWVVGLFTFLKKPQNQPALLLLLCSLALGLALSATLAAERLVPAATHIAIITTILAPFLLLHFFMVLPDNRAKFRKKPLLFLIYIPAVIAVALYPFIGFADGQPLQDFRIIRLFVAGIALLGAMGVAFFNYFGTTYTKTRQQMKIIFFGCLVAIIPLVALSLFPAAFGGTNVMPANFSLLFVVFIPLSMGYAIVTTKFMDIDLFLRRGAIFGGILFMMAALFTIAIVIILALSSPTSITEIIAIALVFSTTATVLFGPLSRWIENIVDRLFFKDRYDHRVIIKDLSNALARLNDFDSACSIIVKTIVNSLDLAGACLLIKTEPAQLQTGACSGVFAGYGNEQRLLKLIAQQENSNLVFPNSASEVDEDIKFLVPLITGEKEIGFLVLSSKSSGGQFSPTDLLLIQDLAVIAAVSLNSILTVNRDVAKRKQAEEALKQSEEKFRLMTEKISDIVWTLDLNLKTTYVSPSVEKILGFTPEERLTQTVEEQVTQKSLKTIHKLLEEELSRDINEMIDPNRTVTFETEYFRKDGSTVWVENKVSAIRDINGKICGLHGISRDIMERKRAAQALEKAARDWRATFDSIDDMIAIIDTNRKILRVNLAFADAFGESPGAMIGRYCYEVVHNMKEPHPLCTLENAVSGKKACCHEIFEPKLEKYLECTVSPLKYEGGECSGVVHIFKDVTARKNMESEQKALRDKAEMSSRLSTVGEMAAGIAHEINNPLTSVLGFSELLLQEDLPPQAKDNFKYIVDGSHRVKDIVKRLLTFARQSKPCKVSLDIHTLIDNTIELRSYVFKTANIEVVKQYDLGLPWIVVDSGQMQQVFLNIIINAEYAMKKAHDRGTLTIVTRKEGNNAVITIQDDGPGIPDEIISKIFDPFFTTKEPGEGTGLGLSISHSIILDQGGNIEVRSKAGSGAVFIISLPLSSDVKEVLPAGKEQSGPDISMKKASILVVDDEESIRTFIGKVLNSQGFSTVNAENARRALEELERGEFGLILLDIRMPGISGRQLYKKIVEKWPRMARKVVFLTGDASDISTMEFFNENNLTYIVKPFDITTLLARISEALSAN